METLCERIETEIPELIIANIEDPERFTRIDVEASSEIEHNKYHPWYEWTTVINVKFRVRDSFDDKSDLDKYYFIDKYGEQAETAIMESGFYALISGYRDSLSDKSKLLKEAYGERVRIDYEYNFYFITSANKYEFAENMKYYFLKNGIDVWVRDAYGNWYGDLPVKPAESEEKNYMALQGYTGG